MAKKRDKRKGKKPDHSKRMKGNENARTGRGKLFEKALRKALQEYAYMLNPEENGGKIRPGEAADFLAKKVVGLAVRAEDPDQFLRLFKEVMDRIDGKPKQSVVGADDGPVQIDKSA